MALFRAELVQSGSCLHIVSKYLGIGTPGVTSSRGVIEGRISVFTMKMQLFGSNDLTIPRPCIHSQNSHVKDFSCISSSLLRVTMFWVQRRKRRSSPSCYWSVTFLLFFYPWPSDDWLKMSLKTCPMFSLLEPVERQIWKKLSQITHFFLFI